MKEPFQVWRYVFQEKGGEHPAVLISHPDLCARSQVVNVLFCTSQRQTRPGKPWEVLLDSADGMDWSTFCNCGIMYAVPSANLFGYRGTVSLERRRAIRAALRDAFRLSATD